jgi:hypothetical protein
MNPRSNQWVVAFLVLSCIVVWGLPDLAEGQENDRKQTESQSLQEQLAELQHQLQEMQTRYEMETQELRNEMGRAGLVSEADSLDELLRLAEEAVEMVDAESEGSSADIEQTFIARGLGLQALNPEISVAGDFLATSSGQENEQTHMDFFFRVLDIHGESYLDPYSKMKVAVGVMPGNTVLGEAYATRFGVLPRLNVTAGKFRQQFGVVNRWHKHALDQIDFPLALRQIFGEGGLNQTGFSINWSPSQFWGASQEAILQITEGENPRIFAENSRHLPSLLFRYKNFRDLSKDTYMEVAATGLFGWNDRWKTHSESGTVFQSKRRFARVLGADLTIRWQPTENMRYASLEWRTELYHMTKSILAPDGSGGDEVTAWGGYTSLQRQLSRAFEIGVRLDYYRPDTKDYADLGLFPLAVESTDAYRWQVGPYLVLWQSPFVKLRLEANYADGESFGPAEFLFAFQTVFAAGPHKHERY